MIAKRVAQTRYLTCASPGYWRARRVPRDPAELSAHDCLAYRSPWGIVLDLWKYRRGDDVRSVAVEPRMVTEDIEWLVEAAVRGAGVVRSIDLWLRPFVEQGLLEPVLGDWEGLEAPPVYVLYRRGSRRSARVRAFVDFMTAALADMEAQRSGLGPGAYASVPKPAWFRAGSAGSLRRREPRLESSKRRRKNVG